MSVWADITFMDVCMTLVAFGFVERFILPVMPETLVGPEGLLLTITE